MELSSVMDLSCIHLDARLPDKESVLRYLSQCLLQSGALTSFKPYLDAVHHRETLSETGLSRGIAIPHGISDAVKKEAIAYVRLKEPIPWESLDGQPVRHIFLLAIPTCHNDSHIQLLSQLARSLIRDDVIERLTQIQKPSELLQLLS